MQMSVTSYISQDAEFIEAFVIDVVTFLVDNEPILIKTAAAATTITKELIKNNHHQGQRIKHVMPKRKI